MLAITMIAMIDQTASMLHGNGIGPLFNTFLTSAVKTHSSTYPAVTPVADLQPDRFNNRR